VRLVVTGARGRLGRAFCGAVPAHHEVVPLGRDELDVGDHDAVMRGIAALAPDAIVHLAAYTDVDGCERDPDRAFRDNAAGAHHVALAARACGAAILHLSTDYVFDGTKGTPYDEADVPSPISTYGRAKALAERLVRETAPEHVIVRSGFLFGSGTDHLSIQVQRVRSGGTGVGIADRVGTPTYVRDLAERLLPLLLARRWGTYHLAGPEATTWLDVLMRCRALGDLPGEVEPQRAVDVGLVAPRPSFSALTSVLVRSTPVPPFPSLDDALARFLAGA
jgi:dTDP-4-dehydrorhamnose reductase